jgi:hypothetical protein
MRERESLTSITRKRVLNRFDHRLHSHSHGRWSEEGFQLHGDHGREDQSNRGGASLLTRALSRCAVPIHPLDFADSLVIILRS